MLFGSSLSSCLRCPHLCDPGMPHRHPWSAPHAERAKAPSTTGTGEPYTESWCQPAIVCASAFFTRQAMLQQRILGPIRSSKISSVWGSSAMSSTHGQRRCDFVFIFFMSLGKRASRASNFRRYSAARSVLMARIGDRYPCSSKSRTCCSVSTLGISTLLRVGMAKGPASQRQPLPENAVLIPYDAITVNRGENQEDRCRCQGHGALPQRNPVCDEKVTR